MFNSQFPEQANATIGNYLPRNEASWQISWQILTRWFSGFNQGSRAHSAETWFSTAGW
jgi:hypothetical protein